MTAIDNLPAPTRKNKRFVLFLPPGEWHDIPLLFAEYLVRAAGYPVVNLGQHVPYEDLDQVIDAVKPTHLLFFIVSGDQQQELNTLLQRLKAGHPDIKCLLGGQTSQLENQDTASNVSKLEEPAAIFRFL